MIFVGINKQAFAVYSITFGNAVLDDVDNIAGSLFRVFIFNKEEVGLLAVADMSKYLFMVNQL